MRKWCNKFTKSLMVTKCLSNKWITNQPQPQRGKKIQKHNWKLVTFIGTSLLGANKKLTQLLWFPILIEFEANLKQSNVMLEYFTQIHTRIVDFGQTWQNWKGLTFSKKKKWTGVKMSHLFCWNYWSLRIVCLWWAFGKNQPSVEAKM